MEDPGRRSIRWYSGDLNFSRDFDIVDNYLRSYLLQYALLITFEISKTFTVLLTKLWSRTLEGQILDEMEYTSALLSAPGFWR